MFSSLCIKCYVAYHAGLAQYNDIAAEVIVARSKPLKLGSVLRIDALGICLECLGHVESGTVSLDVFGRKILAPAGTIKVILEFIRRALNCRVDKTFDTFRYKLRSTLQRVSVILGKRKVIWDAKQIEVCVHEKSLVESPEAKKYV